MTIPFLAIHPCYTLAMKKQKALKFHWEAQKAARNEDKYGVTFEVASSVFQDWHAVYFDDEEHSQNEKREMVIGRASDRRILTCFFTRANDTVHIIAARLATHREKQEYTDANNTRVIYQIK